MPLNTETLIALFGTTQLIVKVLGPTADYLGEGLRNWSDIRIKNIKNIFTIAETKLKSDSKGAVPPKVLQSILAEGSYVDDELVAEYFGGVLASSKSEIPRDDRGSIFLSMLNRLSSYQIRAHFIFYQILKALYDNHVQEVMTLSGRNNMIIFIPIGSFGSAMEFRQGESPEVLISHILHGLKRENLIGENFAWGDENALYSKFTKNRGPGIVLTPAPLGMELFLWANGLSNVPYYDLLDTQRRFISNEVVRIPDGFAKLGGANS